MTLSFVTRFLTSLIISWISLPLLAQDDFWALLQEQPFEFTVADLIANDPRDDAGLDDVEPHITIEPEPSKGVLTRSGNQFSYQPKAYFFGIDTFRYSWIGPSGPIEGVVELFVAPWFTPLAGPMGLLGPNEDPGPEGIGYYNSHSGTFYFCLLPSGQAMDCTPYRYPGFKPGWLPLLGTWQTQTGQFRPNRPGLYDPVARRIYLLDENPADCQTCSDARPLQVLDQFELDSANPSAVIPIAADLDRGGIDSVAFFRPSERRFDDTSGSSALDPELEDLTLWPLTVPDEYGFDELAVFGQESGDLNVLAPQREPARLRSGTASLATARQVGSMVAYGVYDACDHSLLELRLEWSEIDRPVRSGTQILQFPNDPDPPPSGGRTCAQP